MVIDIPILGPIVIEQVHDFYDEPILFTCRGGDGQRYMAMMVDERAAVQTWYYVPMSPERYTQVEHGAVDLHDAFQRAENDQVWQVTTDRTGVLDAVLLIARDLPDDNLPLVGIPLYHQPKL